MVLLLPMADLISLVIVAGVEEVGVAFVLMLGVFLAEAASGPMVRLVQQVEAEEEGLPFTMLILKL